MINFFFKGSIISCLDIINFFFIRNTLPITTFFIIQWIISCVKFSWLIKNQKKEIGNYIVFYILFFCLLIILHSYFVQMFNNNTVDFYTCLLQLKLVFFETIKLEFFWKETLCFILIFFFIKKIKIQLFAYCYMVVEIIHMVIKELLVHKNYNFLIEKHDIYRGFIPVCKNFLFYNGFNVDNNPMNISIFYSYYNQIFSIFQFFVIFSLVLNLKNVSLDDYIESYKTNKNILVLMIFIIWAMFISNYFLPNYYWFSLYMKLLIIITAYIQMIGARIFYRYLDEYGINFYHFYVILVVINSFFNENNVTIFSFFFNFFFYLTSFIVY